MIAGPSSWMVTIFCIYGILRMVVDAIKVILAVKAIYDEKAKGLDDKGEENVEKEAAKPRNKAPRPARPETVSVGVQGPVTYTRNRSRPRYQPLADYLW